MIIVGVDEVFRKKFPTDERPTDKITLGFWNEMIIV